MIQIFTPIFIVILIKFFIEILKVVQIIVAHTKHCIKISRHDHFVKMSALLTDTVLPRCHAVRRNIPVALGVFVCITIVFNTSYREI